MFGGGVGGLFSAGTAAGAGGGGGTSYDSTKGKKPVGQQQKSRSIYSLLLILELFFFLSLLTSLSSSTSSTAPPTTPPTHPTTSWLPFLLLTSTSSLWAPSLPLFTSLLRRQGLTRSSISLGGKYQPLITTFLILFLAYLFDATLNTTPLNPVKLSWYVGIGTYLVVVGGKNELVPTGGAGGFVGGEGGEEAWVGKCCLISSAGLAGLAILSTFFSSTPFPSLSTLLPLSIFGFLFLYLDPVLSRTLITGRGFSKLAVGIPSNLTNLLALVLMKLLWSYFGTSTPGLSLAEGGILILSWLGISSLLSLSSPPPTTLSTTIPSTPFLSSLTSTFSHTLTTILRNPESRRIYYFLLLNLGYMFIQLLWGVWSNSLGLISDSIHMFFDCLALGMGLVASVVGEWKGDERFTYGYSRIETLSGFANSLFLLLISTFIVFEAIERLINPPEMNTGQLLIVSCGGLAVNLVGMLATGGHHHHGHSHGGHDHGPPPPPATKSVEGSNNHDHSHSDHSHDDHSHDDHDHSTHSHSHSGHSHNMKGVFLHVLADTLGSVGVIISTLLINRYGWTGFDPLASIFIALMIFASVVQLVIDSGRLLVLDLGEEKEVEVRMTLNTLNRIEGVSSYTSPRFWPKGPESVIGSISIQLVYNDSVPGGYSGVEKVVERVKRELRKGISGLEEVTVQVEGREGWGGL